MVTFFLNLAIAIGLLYIGAYAVCLVIAKFIIESSDAEILAKIRELREKTKEYENDY